MYPAEDFTAFVSQTLPTDVELTFERRVKKYGLNMLGISTWREEVCYSLMLLSHIG